MGKWSKSEDRNAVGGEICIKGRAAVDGGHAGSEDFDVRTDAANVFERFEYTIIAGDATDHEPSLVQPFALLIGGSCKGTVFFAGLLLSFAYEMSGEAVEVFHP